MPNAGGEPRPRAGATPERRLLGVGSLAFILIEGPPSSYRRGMLSLGNNHSHEEETSCDSTPTNTHFTAASTCMPAPCTSVSCVRTARLCCTETYQPVPTPCSRPSRPIGTILSSPSNVSLRGTGSPTCVHRKGYLLSWATPCI